MPFSNTILGGGASLTRNAIKSPNFLPGLQGWTINKDGTAEFADLTVRGQIIVENNDDGIFVYAYIPG